jgi:hypothetical protein
MNGIFVHNNIFLTSAHLLWALDNVPDSNVTLSSHIAGISYTIPVSAISKNRVVQLSGEKGDCIDAMLIKMPDNVKVHRSLLKNFISSDQQSKLRMFNGRLTTLTENEHVGMMFSTTTVSARAFDGIDTERTISLPDGVTNWSAHKLRHYYRYQAPTQSGDCGSPLSIINNQFPRKLVGIHGSGDSTGYGYAVPITQERLERAIGKLNDISASPLCKTDLDLGVPLEGLVAQGYELQNTVAPDGKFVPVAFADSMPYAVGKTDISPSPIQDTYSKHTQKPAKLRPFFKDGILLEPMKKGLGKADYVPVYIEEELVQSASEVVASSIRTDCILNCKSDHRKVLNLVDACKSDPDDEFLNAVNRQSSPGFPFVMERPAGVVGKQHLIDENGEMSNELISSCEDRLRSYDKGVRHPTVWTDHLKDERRPIAKVDLGKTRLFAGAPIDFVVVFRMYFLAFISHLAHGRIDNGMCVGINPYDEDWSKLVMALKLKSNKVIAGDFSNYDGTLPPQFLWSVCEIANKWYSDGNDDIRRLLMADVINAVHLVQIAGQNVVYEWIGSIPSGFP